MINYNQTLEPMKLSKRDLQQRISNDGTSITRKINNNFDFSNLREK